MLNAASKQGISEILASLDDSTVLALATTITQGLLKSKLSNRHAAVNAILSYSTDAVSFLRRKIITREVILAYLDAKKVPVSLPTTKNDLVERTAKFWQIQEIHDEVETKVDSGTIDEMALRFVQWFYQLFNRNEPMDPQHFFCDAKLMVNTSNNGDNFMETVEGDAEQIVKKLLMLRLSYSLSFNPNLSGGVQGKLDPHGLVLVLVCGTLHTGNMCVGVFEQVFGLVRDPNAENNWKIKTTELHLKSSNGAVEPPAVLALR